MVVQAHDLLLDDMTSPEPAAAVRNVLVPWLRAAVSEVPGLHLLVTGTVHLQGKSPQGRCTVQGKCSSALLHRRTSHTDDVDMHTRILMTMPESRVWSYLMLARIT